MTAPIRTSVFRFDKFAVPPEALPAFMRRLRWIDETLAARPGCRQNRVMTDCGGGEFNVATLVEWASPQAMAAARDLLDPAAEQSVGAMLDNWSPALAGANLVEAR